MADITNFELANGGQIILKITNNNEIVIEFNTDIRQWVKDGIIIEFIIMKRSESCDTIKIIRNDLDDEANITGLIIKSKRASGRLLRQMINKPTTNLNNIFEPITARFLHTTIFDIITKKYGGIIVT